MGGIRSHGRGFQVDVRVRGERRRRVVATREAAEALLREWSEEARVPVEEPAPEVTLAQVLGGWVAHRAVVSGKPRSVQAARASGRRLARWFGRALPAAKLTARMLDQYVEACRARGMRPRSINLELVSLKAALRWAADPERGALLEKLPTRVRLVPAPRITGATVRRLIPTDAQVERLLDAATTPKLRCILALCAFAGLRQGEALHLKVGDVDLERGPSSTRLTLYSTASGDACTCSRPRKRRAPSVRWHRRRLA